MRRQRVILNFTIDGGGAQIATGVWGDAFLPADGDIVEWHLSADRTGSIVIDIWKVAFGSYPSTVANTITGTLLPTLTSARSNSDKALAGWTRQFSAGDILTFNVNSVSLCQRVLLALTLARR